MTSNTAPTLPELALPTALVTSELQRGVVGDLSPLPELAAAATPILGTASALCAAARDAEIPVLHCTALRRADGAGAGDNARLFRYMAKQPPLLEGSARAALVPELDVQPEDIVLSRLHGLSPFQGAALDGILRNLGVATLVIVGVSVNVAVTNLAFDAVNAGYRVVIPTDAVAGTPADYVEAVFEHTLRNVARLARAEDVLAHWRR